LNIKKTNCTLIPNSIVLREKKKKLTSPNKLQKELYISKTTNGEKKGVRKEIILAHSLARWALIEPNS
jgi:hypothetical protein